MRTRVGVGLVGVIMLLLIAPAGASVPAAGDIEVTGEVDGLYPGAMKTLDARVTNPLPFTIRVTSLGASVGNASPGCLASMLEVDTSTTTVDVAPGATGTVPVRVRMDHSAPDACESVTFPLVFAATAVDTGFEPTSPNGPIQTGSGSLAFTGTDIAKVLAVALALVALGVLARGAARRRRRTAS